MPFAIKKRLGAVEETKTLLHPVEDNQKPIIIITREDTKVKDKLEKAEARVEELIDVLFTTAAEADERFLQNILIDPDAAMIARYKRDGVIEVIKRAGLYEQFKMWEANSCI